MNVDWQSTPRISMALPDTTVTAFADYIAAVRSQQTAIKYAQGAAKFLAFCGHHKLPMDKLPPGILAIFAESLVPTLKPRSIHVMVTAARRYLEWCRSRGELIPNLPKTDLPKPVHELPNSLKGDSLLLFLKLTARLPEPARSAILLMPYCGLRTHELVTLPMKSVSKIKMNTRDGPREMFCFTVRGKGGKIRVVPLVLDGPSILRLYVSNYRSRFAGRWMFPMADGAHISDRTIRHHVLAISRLMKARRLSPHTLRRTYLTTLHKAGLDTVTLTAIAGHESVQTTFRHYIDISPEDMANSMATKAPRLIMQGPNDHLIGPASKSINDFLSDDPDDPEE